MVDELAAQSMTGEKLAAQGMQIAAHALQHPDRLAIRSLDGDRSFHQLNARANQLARAFGADGLRPGDALALLGHNGPEFVEVWAASQRLGWYHSFRFGKGRAIKRAVEQQQRRFRCVVPHVP